MLSKLFYKLFNPQKYKDLKKEKQIRETVKIFEKKYKSYFDLLDEKIKKNKRISFLHSGHCGDIIFSLPVIKELSKTHECNLYIRVNKKMSLPYLKHPGKNVYIDNRMLNIFLPLLKTQKFIHSVKKYDNEEIDINFDLFRELPVNILFNQPRWFFHVSGVQVDLSEPYLDVDPHKKIIDKIVIHRTFRYRNQFINYKFLKKYKNLVFIGLKDEFEDLKKDVKNLIFYNCEDFLEMAQIIKASKFFIGNQSIAYPMAEAMKVPRILEGCPYFPVSQPIGKNAFDFYYQPHFEKWCELLNSK
jgi:hypothetical protein